MQLVLPKGKVTATCFVAIPFLQRNGAIPTVIIYTGMEITVNQQAYQVTHGCSVEQMLRIVLNQPAKGLAVAINQTIVPKAAWQQHQLSSGDQIIIIKATQGG